MRRMRREPLRSVRASPRAAGGRDLAMKARATAGMAVRWLVPKARREAPLTLPRFLLFLPGFSAPRSLLPCFRCRRRLLELRLHRLAPPEADHCLVRAAARGEDRYVGHRFLPRGNISFLRPADARPSSSPSPGQNRCGRLPRNRFLRPRFAQVPGCAPPNRLNPRGC